MNTPAIPSTTIDKLWLLSYEEADILLNFDKNITSFESTYFLRSGGANGHLDAISENGEHFIGGDYPESSSATRPAFQISF